MEPFGTDRPSSAALPVASFALPWDDPDSADPVGSLRAAREELGDSFIVESGTDTYCFVFSALAIRAFYELPERLASKGLADYSMLVRKLPDELFAGPRTMAHDLFGPDRIETYLNHLDHALEVEYDELGARGSLDCFDFARRVGHRLGLSCWLGPAAAESPWFEPMRADLEVLDGAEAFVHPALMSSIGESDRSAERAALGRVEARVADMIDQGVTGEFLDEISRRWDDEAEPVRSQGIARDVVLLHVATMTNLFAAIGWTVGQLALHPDLAADAVGDGSLMDRCISESIRMGQRSIMMRSVLRPCSIDDGVRTIELSPGRILATTLAITNVDSLPGLDRFDPARWDGRRLQDEHLLGTPELVATFGFGAHRCPAQRFSRQAIARTATRLFDGYDLTPGFAEVRPLPGQIGGVGRAADPCPLDYRRR